MPSDRIVTSPLAADAPRSVGVQAALVVLAAFVLPALAHATGVATTTWLPMHWPVLLAGLCYGARGGALVGAAAPVAAFAASGAPVLAVLPAMIAECATYGAVAGAGRAGGAWRRVAAIAAALVLGRVAFVAVMAAEHGDARMAVAGLAAGVPAAIAQLVALPLLSAWWVRREALR